MRPKLFHFENNLTIDLNRVWKISAVKFGVNKFFITLGILSSADLNIELTWWAEEEDKAAALSAAEEVQSRLVKRWADAE